MTALAGGYDELLRPRSVAIVGASTSKLNLGRIELRHLRSFGFEGDLYAIHPSAEAIDGVPARPSIRDIAGGVDYAYVALPAEAVAGFLRDAAGHVRWVQVVTGGFAEAGRPELEAEVADVARQGGMRLIGPNCLGVHCPRGGMTFIDRASRTPGSTAVLSQSGGLATDIIRQGGVRGIGFSHVVTLGNSADVGMEELLAHAATDPQTERVALYVESLHDGPAFMEAVRSLVPDKPVVVLRGGISEQGRRSGQSHTGGMATAERVWNGICDQLGVIRVRSLEELLDTLVALRFARHPVGRRLVLVGPGGGISVVASDSASRFGFELMPLREETVAGLEALGIATGSSLLNPIDTPVAAMAVGGGAVTGSLLRTVMTHERPDLVLVHLNLQNFLSYLDDGQAVVSQVVEGVAEAATAPVEIALSLRGNGEAEIEAVAQRELRRAIDAGVPVYGSIDRALGAYAHVRRFQERTASRAG